MEVNKGLLVAFVLLTLGCGTSPPAVPVTVVNPPIVSNDAEAIKDWPKPDQTDYELGKVAIAKYLLELPREETTWLAPVRLEPLPDLDNPVFAGKRITNIRRVSGVVYAPTESGTKVKRDWTVTFYERGGLPHIVMKCTLGNKEHDIYGPAKAKFDADMKALNDAIRLP